MAFTISVPAAILFLIAVPLLSLVIFGIMRITRPRYRKTQEVLDGVTTKVRENLTGVRVVRAFGREKSETELFREKNELLTQRQLAVGRISALMNPLTFALVNLTLIGILWTGAFEINVGNLAAGNVIALVNYLSQILIELVKLANLIVTGTRALASADRVQSVMDQKSAMSYGSAVLTADPKVPAVVFEQVSLTYPGAGGESLSNISFSANAGVSVGIIGGTGSGKFPAFMTRQMARCVFSAGMSGNMRRILSTGALRWCCRKRSCFPGQYARIL